MGVSGCGKSTIGKLLSRKLGLEFYDADDSHSKANVEKMKMGIPLSDEDRFSWLLNISEKIINYNNSGVVIACSALKESYRKILTRNDNIQVQFIYLKGNFEHIFQMFNDMGYATYYSVHSINKRRNG